MFRMKGEKVDLVIGSFSLVPLFKNSRSKLISVRLKCFFEILLRGSFLFGWLSSYVNVKKGCESNSKMLKVRSK